MKRITFVNRSYTKGVPFLSQTVYKWVRGWTFGRNPPYKTLLSTPRLVRSCSIRSFQQPFLFRQSSRKQGGGGGSATRRNMPFSSFKNSHFQNQANCKTFLVKMNFICMKIKSHCRINGFALSLALKQRLGATRKWSIGTWGRNRSFLSIIYTCVKCLIALSICPFT